jgi:hypothetical protein
MLGLLLLPVALAGPKSDLKAAVAAHDADEAVEVLLAWTGGPGPLEPAQQRLLQPLLGNGATLQVLLGPDTPRTGGVLAEVRLELPGGAPVETIDLRLGTHRLCTDCSRVLPPEVGSASADRCRRSGGPLGRRLLDGLFCAPERVARTVDRWNAAERRAAAALDVAGDVLGRMVPDEVEHREHEPTPEPEVPLPDLSFMTEGPAGDATIVRSRREPLQLGCDRYGCDGTVVFEPGEDEAAATCLTVHLTWGLVEPALHWEGTRCLPEAGSWREVFGDLRVPEPLAPTDARWWTGPR